MKCAAVGQVRIGILAPREVPVRREDVAKSQGQLSWALSELELPPIKKKGSRKLFSGPSHAQCLAEGRKNGENK
jgi:hypothetical protein